MNPNTVVDSLEYEKTVVHCRELHFSWYEVDIVATNVIFMALGEGRPCKSHLKIVVHKTRLHGCGKL